MTLKEACKIGKATGCRTVGEAILNIEIHAVSLFSWPEMVSELRELAEDAAGIDDDCPIEKVLADG